MKRLPTSVQIALAVSTFLGSLTLVAWRQGQAYGVMSEVDRLRTEKSLEEATAAELSQRIRLYESDAWIIEQAVARLGMHRPTGEEVRILMGDDQ
jgi:hypothetical protein